MKPGFMAALMLLSGIVLGQLPPPVPILSPIEMQVLENKLAESPADVQSQTLLAKNYAFFVLGVTELDPFDQVHGHSPTKSTSDYAVHARKVLTETNQPVIAGEAGHALWTHSESLRSYLIRKGAPHTTPTPEKEFGAKLMQRAITLDPKNQQWRIYYQSVLEFRGRPLVPGRTHVFEAMQENVNAIGGDTHFYLLSSLAKQAIIESKLDDAKEVADEMLALVAKSPEHMFSGRATFDANMVLGTIALRRGDVRSADAHLIAAGAAKGQPSLGSFGPSLKLAKSLLDAGERDAVLEFFGLMSSSWPNESLQFARWSEDVRSGRKPDFGMYLIY